MTPILTDVVGVPATITKRDQLTGVAVYDPPYLGGDAVGAGVGAIPFKWVEARGRYEPVTGDPAQFRLPVARADVEGVPAYDGRLLVELTWVDEQGVRQTTELELLAEANAQGVLNLTETQRPIKFTAATDLLAAMQEVKGGREVLDNADAARLVLLDAAQGFDALAAQVQPALDEMAQATDTVLDQAAQATADALAVAGINLAYVSETTADPPAAPENTKGAKRLADGSLQRLIRTAGAWVAAGASLAPATLVTPLQTTRAALATGTVTAAVGTRLLDEYGPLRARAAGVGEVADNGLTYALPGGLIAEREDDGTPAHADWFNIPENTGGQTARWQAAADAAFKRKARVLEAGNKSYILDGTVITKVSVRAPGAQFLVPVGNATTYTGKFSVVPEGDPVIYTDAPHLVPGGLPLANFTPGLDVITDGTSIIPALAPYAHQTLNVFSSVPSSHRLNGLYDETYERLDCVIPDAGGQLNAAPAFDYTYPAAALAAVEWSAATVYKHGDFVKKTVGGQTYLFVCTYPSGPGTTLHTTSAAIGAQAPNHAQVNTTVAGTSGGTYGGVRVWLQLYRKVTVYPRQRAVTIDTNIRVQGTHAVATDVLIGSVVAITGRSDVYVHGNFDTDNPRTNVDSLISVAHVAGFNVLPGTRVSGARYSGLGYNILITNVSRASADGLVSTGCRDGWAGRHGNGVYLRNSEICRVDDHYGVNMVLENLQLTTSSPTTTVYAVAFGGRNITLRNVVARNCLSLLQLRTDVAYRGGAVTLDGCTLIPSGSSSNSALVYGAVVLNLAPGALAAGFTFGTPCRWPVRTDVSKCTIEAASDGTSYGFSRSFVDYAMDTVTPHVLPGPITVRDGVMGHASEYGGVKVRFYGADLTKYTGTAPVPITIENTKAFIGSVVRVGLNDTQATLNAAWNAFAGTMVTYDVRGGQVMLYPSLQLPASYTLRGTAVEAFVATGIDLPTAGTPARAVITAISAVIGSAADAITPVWGPAFATGTLKSRFIDCEFTKSVDASWAAANILDGALNRVRLTTGGATPANVPGVIGPALSAAITAQVLGSKKFRVLPTNVSGVAAWLRLARLQATNPVTSQDYAAFAGELVMQPGRNTSSYRHYRAEFGFGGTYNNAATNAPWQHVPLLEEVYSNPNPAPEWRVVRTADGWVDLYVLIPTGTSSIGITYDLWSVAEPVGAWTYSDPPADSTLLWSSLNGPRAVRNGGDIYINGVRVLTARQVAIPSSDGTLADTVRALNAALAMLRVHGLIAP